MSAVAGRPLLTMGSDQNNKNNNMDRSKAVGNREMASHSDPPFYIPRIVREVHFGLLSFPGLEIFIIQLPVSSIVGRSGQHRWGW